MGLFNDARKVWESLLEPVIATDSTRADRLDRMFQHTAVWVKNVADAAANTNTDAAYFYRAPSAQKVVSCYLLPSNAVTADSTDYDTITVQKGDGAAGTPVDVATVSTVATGNAAGTSRGMTLDSTAANLLLDAGDTLCVEILKIAAGKSMGVDDTVVVRLVEI